MEKDKKSSIDKLVKKVTKKGKKGKLFWVVVVSFLLVPIIVSCASIIHVVDFFEISTPSSMYWLAIYSAAAFEVGLLSCLIALAIITKIKEVEWIVILVFILLTVYQCVGNSYYAYNTISIKMANGEKTLLDNFAELLWMTDYLKENIIAVKRVYSWAAGGILPIISLAFWHMLAVFVKKIEEEGQENNEENNKNEDLKEKELIQEQNNTEIKKEKTTPMTPIDFDLLKAGVKKEEPLKELIFKPQDIIFKSNPVALEEKDVEIKFEPSNIEEEKTGFNLKKEEEYKAEPLNTEEEIEEENVGNPHDIQMAENEIEIEQQKIEEVKEEIKINQLNKKELSEENKKYFNEIIDKKGRIEDYIENKIEKLKQDRIKFPDLLYILFNNGEANSGDTLPSYNEFISRIDKSATPESYAKHFLTLCNYLDVAKMDDVNRKALMNYKDAVERFEAYLNYSNS